MVLTKYKEIIPHTAEVLKQWGLEGADWVLPFPLLPANEKPCSF